MPATRPLTAPASFHVMTKPTGAICNLDCAYCFYLDKESLYPGDRALHFGAVGQVGLLGDGVATSNSSVGTERHRGG